MMTHEKNSDDRFDLTIKNRERGTAFLIMRILIASMAIALFTAHCDNKGGSDGSGGSSNASSGDGGLTCTKALMGGTSNCALSLTAAATTFAGASQGSADGTGTAATFDQPFGITTDGSNLYVAEQNNHRIRKIVIATGVVTTLAGSSAGNADGTGTSAAFSSPQGITTDGTNLYVADYGNHRIRKIVIATGVVTTLAGSVAGSYNATGTAARFCYPSGITTDGTNVYVVDYGNYIIRKIVIATAVVTTVAGNSGGTPGNADGTGTAATFNEPSDLTTDGSNLYVADQKNNRIRKIVIATGVVTTLAGSSQGNADGTGMAATFRTPWGITTDGTNLFVTDYGNFRIRKILIATGVVTTLAGSSAGNADGTGTVATFGSLSGITTDGTYLYVADTGNHRIRKIQ